MPSNTFADSSCNISSRIFVRACENVCQLFEVNQKPTASELNNHQTIFYEGTRTVFFILHCSSCSIYRVSNKHWSHIPRIAKQLFVTLPIMCSGKENELCAKFACNARSFCLCNKRLKPRFVFIQIIQHGCERSCPTIWTSSPLSLFRQAPTCGRRRRMEKKFWSKCSICLTLCKSQVWQTHDRNECIWYFCCSDFVKLRTLIFPQHRCIFCVIHACDVPTLKSWVSEGFFQGGGQ